ncbi:MAG TPA: sarcosine oxidase subunit delta [Flavitalea sp.]|nr:sarcosine oxidase subunit delta [Flavitalea sp.]
MLYIPCPYCGRRNETEFHYGAEAGVGYPDPNAMTDTEWAKYLHIRDNPKGWLAERWVHFAGCGRWFNLWRNTTTHEIGPAWLPFTTQPNLPGLPGQSVSESKEISKEEENKA